jgi:CBS domain containing-hemolysin-like protein
MKSKTVKELMIPLSEYAVVFEDATLYEAFLALEKAQAAFEKSGYTHRAILVRGKSGDIIGKVSQLDVLMGLEPKYKKIGEMQSISNLGFSKEFLQNLISQYSLWDAPLEDICRKASRTIVKNIMYTPTEGEFVEDAAALDQAIHQLVMGKHQSLLVTRNAKIVGILRLVDVFKEIFEQIKSCRI